MSYVQKKQQEFLRAIITLPGSKINRGLITMHPNPIKVNKVL
ncbi:hypothetical protein H5410_027409 [Solanum commersonii]|uniref:Uncharacterized protein n=1 Tax=Solanum commersonii TaxID=4109 RepID=A0A9J5Z169_SOLCO|nr:hypothetical protein H5410_027409 [Solanum commersonii]